MIIIILAKIQKKNETALFYCFKHRKNKEKQAMTGK